MFVAPMNGQTWVVCGGRDFSNAQVFDGAMSDLLRLRGCPIRVVHGAARGADTLADGWGNKMAVPVTRIPADWDAHGRAAGPLRNQKILDEYPVDLVIAFPGGRGTADMVRRARTAGIDVAEITLPPTPSGAAEELFGMLVYEGLVPIWDTSNGMAYSVAKRCERFQIAGSTTEEISKKAAALCSALGIEDLMATPFMQPDYYDGVSAAWDMSHPNASKPP